ncbi:OmpA family protein [Collimonas fungivorans]|nr:OmpA family protein [Collimonas fungivorans]
MKQRSMDVRSVPKTMLAVFLAIAAGLAFAQSTEVKFPDRDSAMHKEGIFVSVENLRNVGPGLTKNQMYDLLGPPHFHEGVFGVKVWNYIFNFRQNGGVVTCQYQVQFDKDKLVRETYWKYPACADFLKEKVVAPVVVPIAAKPEKMRRYDLSADTLFIFGRSDLDDMLPAGRKQLDDLSDKIKSNTAALKRITITGHTDRIGSEASNLRLSLARAATVRGYLRSQGIDGNLIQIHGVGASQPVVTTCAPGKSAAVIACLQPNRRVTLDVSSE